jgi:hypothetical protein
MHPNIAIALINSRRDTCPCGAHADEPYGYCRKCLARIAWRRHHRRTPRRRRAGTLVRRVARIFNPSASTGRPNTRPADAQPATAKPGTPGTPTSASLAHPSHDDSGQPIPAAIPGGESDA